MQGLHLPLGGIENLLQMPLGGLEQVLPAMLAALLGVGIEAGDQPLAGEGAVQLSAR